MLLHVISAVQNTCPPSVTPRLFYVVGAALIAAAIISVVIYLRRKK